ncbi:MAG: class I SAM-dependent methyltransferase [Xanthobacteraceae bacterium]|nr:class I SAM-dependent methyltransferase [Xanthobacteraceae bacterium]MCW5675303.1 class I SAM-dependent methyltransferase [Xanthobacteraceae bacterium]
MRDWISYWDSDHPIYVNARHFDVHYANIASDIVRLVPSKAARVLDYGCGEALHADKIAAHCATLYLCEAAPTVRTRLQERFGKIANIAVVTPEEVAAMEPESLDLIVANSLLQYLKRNELLALLKVWRRLLAPGGALVLADIIDPKQSALADALSLLNFARKNGFLTAAFIGLVKTTLSDYRKLRAQLGLTTYAEAEMLKLLADAGYDAARLRPNLGHNQGRMAFRAQKNAALAG